jgi:divinyl protochlorophyllide a 8-vinyl-reductase
VALSEGDLSPAPEVHRIGPNAVTRVAEALRPTLSEGEVARLFDLAGIARYLNSPPQRMVDEREVTALHRVLRSELGVPRALAVAREAGVRTGDYLLANRIPKPVQSLLWVLPARLASRVLIGAIARHAWTFAGSGEFSTEPGPPVRLAIAGCCICRGAQADAPLCDFYAAAIERLFRVLVHRDAVVTETTCQAMGADACTFQIRW